MCLHLNSDSALPEIISFVVKFFMEHHFYKKKVYSVWWYWNTVIILVSVKCDSFPLFCGWHPVGESKRMRFVIIIIYLIMICIKSIQPHRIDKCITEIIWALSSTTLDTYFITCMYIYWKYDPIQLAVTC